MWRSDITFLLKKKTNSHADNMNNETLGSQIREILSGSSLFTQHKFLVDAQAKTEAVWIFDFCTKESFSGI